MQSIRTPSGSAAALFRGIFVTALACLLLGKAAWSQERPAEWRTEFIDLTVELDPLRGRLSGDAGLELAGTAAAGGDILLSLNHQLHVDAVVDGGGVPLPFRQSGDGLSIELPPAASPPAPRAIRVRYQGSFREPIPELGLHNAWIGPKVAYAFHSSRWYPQPPEPGRRSRGRITYIAPAGWTVASCGRLTAVADGRHVYAAAAPTEFSFAAGPFVHQRRSVDGLDVGIFFLRGDQEKIDYYQEKCLKLIRYFRELFGFFPHESYSLVELPQPLLGKTGAASYDGLTFFPAAALPKRFFYIPVFAHEIAHCWWGNCIRGEEGPVINEGLAQISMGLYLEQVLGRRYLWSLLKNGAPEFYFLYSARLFFSALRAAKAPDDSLDALLLRGEDLELGVAARDKFATLHMLASCKGFFVFAMLREWIGAEAFRQGLRAALARFAWGSMTLEDLRAQFERASGRELEWFFRQWFQRKGAPEFAIDCRFAERSRNWQVWVTVTQLREVYRVKAEIAFQKGAFREIRQVEIDGRESSFSFLVPFKPQAVLFDPDYHILRWSEQI
jgi:aminopeptidase N